jgi:UDP-glucose 4-epimerase
MRILVTGGNGFIGFNLIKRLISEGHEVTSLDNLSTGKKEYVVKGCRYVYGNVESIERLNNADYKICYHLAALSRIQPSFQDPSSTFLTNTNGTQCVLEWARRRNTKVIYAGSSSRHHNPYQSPYACYKYLGEEICKMYKQVYNQDIEIVRFYNVYGPGELIDGDWAAVIGVWRRQIRDNEPITVVGTGKQKRDFTYIDDIVDGIFRIGISDVKHTDAWELGTGISYPIIDVANMFVERFNCKIKFIEDQRGNYKGTLRVNDDSLKLLNWSPKDRLKDYILNL